MSGIINDTLSDADKTHNLAAEAVFTQVIIMSSLTVATVLAFNLLRPKNRMVYAPKVKYYEGDKQPPKISDGFFAWISPLVHTKEPELLDKIGLDAVAFLRFLRMGRWLFTVVAALTCGVLIPINIIITRRNNAQSDLLSQLTVRDVTGSFVYAHVAVTYLITFITFAFVWIHWSAMVRLRSTWFRSREYQESFYARTLMIRNVKKQYQSDEGLRTLLDSTQMPYPTSAVHIGRKVGQLPELVAFHNDTVRGLEGVLVRYLKNGEIGKKRPTITQGGFLGMGGEKIDAIDYYTAKLQRTESAIVEYRNTIDMRKAVNYGFASMAAVPHAHIVAQKLQGKKPKGAYVELAPNPKDIIWSNLTMSDGERARKKTIGWVWLIIFCAFNTVPVLVIATLANLTTLTGYIGPLGTWQGRSRFTFNMVAGVLPPVVQALFGWLFPIAMRFLSRYQGAVTQSRLDRAVVARYFAFLIINNLIIFTLYGLIFGTVKDTVARIGHQSIGEIVGALKDVPQSIYTSLIDTSSYWLTVFPLRGVLVVFDLAQLLNLAWVWMRTRLFGRTPRDIREWTQPPDFDYASYYSNMLFLATIGLIYAPQAPLVALGAAIVFWMSSWTYKYQLMFVYVSKVESGGRLWNSVVNRLLACLLFMQLVMVLTIGLQDNNFRTLQWLSTIPPVLFTIIFKIILTRTFDNRFKYYIPSESELAQAKLHSTRADLKGHRLEKRFGHPSLHADLFTPMLHAKMMHLLPEVYHGRLSHDKATMQEYGNQKMEAQVLPGGIKIAAVSQHELDYDPALYQRDRGEIDWDARSKGSRDFLHDGASSLHPGGPSNFYADGRTTPAPRYDAYEQYMAQGPSRMRGDEQHELHRIDTRGTDQQPLLQQLQPVGSYFNQSTRSLPYQSPRAVTPDHSSPLEEYSYPPQQVRSQQPHFAMVSTESFGQAPSYRPPLHSRSATGWSQAGQPPPPSTQNMAGRGAYRG